MNFNQLQDTVVKNCLRNWLLNKYCICKQLVTKQLIEPLQSIALTIYKIFPDSAIDISICFSYNIKLLVVPFAWPIHTFRTWWKIWRPSIWITYFWLAILQKSKNEFQQQEKRLNSLCKPEDCTIAIPLISSKSNLCQALLIVWSKYSFWQRYQLIIL